MKTYKIIIAGSEVDLYDNTNIGLAITAAIADTNDLTVRKGTNVKTIKIPATGINKVIFGHPEDINSVVSLSQASKPAASIEADGTRIFKGYAKVNGTTDIATQLLTEYELTFIGDNADWVSRLQGKYLTDLDYSDQNHIRDCATIIASETVAVGREYVYDLIDRGKSRYGLDYGSPVKSPVNILDRLPAISFSSFVDRIFNGIGYKVESDFRNGDFFKSLYFPFVNDRLECPQTNSFTCHIKSTSSQMVLDGGAYEQTIIQSGNVLNTNPSGAFNQISFNKYFVNSSGKYGIDGIITFKGYGIETTSVAEFNVMKKQAYSTESARSIYFQSNTFPSGATPNINTINIPSNQTFDLEYGDEVYFSLKLIGGSSSTWLILQTVDFQITSATNLFGVGEGKLLDMTLNLPKNILQLNFIQALKDCFNLYFTADTGARIVYFEPRDEFYTDEIEDWSALLDRGKDVQTQFTGSSLSKTMRYRYKSDSNDKILSDYETQKGYPFSSNDAGVDNVFATDEVKEITNTLFAPTWMEPSQRLGFTTTNIPKMWSDVSLPPQSTKFEPRILFYNGIKQLPTGEYWKFTKFGNISWQQAFPFAGIRSDYPSFTFFDESQPNENNLMYCDSVYSSGLFQKHFRNGQKTIDNGRQYSAYINLNDVYMSNLDFRKKKYIEEAGNGAYFILEKVTDYKSQDGESTLCLFTKITSKIAKKRLLYQDNNAVPVPFHGGIRSSIGISNDGTELLISGKKSMSINEDGTLSAGWIYTIEPDGTVVPVYLLDENNDIKNVIKG